MKVIWVCGGIDAPSGGTILPAMRRPGKTTRVDAAVEAVRTRFDDCADDRLAVRIDDDPGDQPVRIRCGSWAELDRHRTARRINQASERGLVAIGDGEHVEQQRRIEGLQAERAFRVDGLVLPAVARNDVFVKCVRRSAR
jgi:hypothetical protein